MVKQERFLVHFRELYLPSSRGTQSQTVRAEGSVILNSTEIYWRDQGYKYVTGCNAGGKYERLLERWWRSRVVRYVDKFHKAHRIGWKNTGWKEMVQEETEKKTNDRQTRHSVARDLERHVRSCEAKRKAKSGLSKNRSSTIPEHCLVFTSLILLMENLTISWKMRVEGWKFQCQQQCLANFKVRNTEKPDADESTRKCMEGTLHQGHKDHIANKKIYLMNHYNLVHKFTLMPQAMKIPDAKSSSG